MTYVSAELRRLVTERAGNCCEYCLLSREDVSFSFHIEHIIAEKHGGVTSLENLALSCPACNGFKGSDLSSVDWDGGGEVITLFNPRKHRWFDHFRLNEALIESITPQGRVTIALLRLNNPERLIQRDLLIRLGRYPCGEMQ